MVGDTLEVLHAFSVTLNFLVGHVPAHGLAKMDVDTVCAGEMSAKEGLWSSSLLRDDGGWRLRRWWME